jgi:hypothetical protein
MTAVTATAIDTLVKKVNPLYDPSSGEGVGGFAAEV